MDVLMLNVYHKYINAQVKFEGIYWNLIEIIV